MQNYLQDLNKRYLDVHTRKEDNFWSSKMRLRDAKPDLAEQAETDFNRFITNADELPKIREALKNAKRVFVPEFNQAGWLHKELCSTLYGQIKADIIPGPRVYGGMTMPTEMVLEWLAKYRK